MRRTTKAVLAAAVVAAGLLPAAANAATATANAKANILRQVTVSKTADLDFATIITGAAASTVQVSTAGVRTCGVGLTCTGTPVAGAFNVTGTTGAVVAITVPATVTLSSGTNTMVATLTGSASTLTLAAANNNFTVGGTLAVGAAQADGQYTGSFTVNVDYQ